MSYRGAASCSVVFPTGTEVVHFLSEDTRFKLHQAQFSLRYVAVSDMQVLQRDRNVGRCSLILKRQYGLLSCINRPSP